MAKVLNQFYTLKSSYLKFLPYFAQYLKQMIEHSLHSVVLQSQFDVRPYLWIWQTAVFEELSLIQGVLKLYLNRASYHSGNKNMEPIILCVSFIIYIWRHWTKQMLCLAKLLYIFLTVGLF